MLFSIDRIVGQTAELIGEDRKPLQVPSNMLPRDARSGDMLWYENGRFAPAKDKAEARRRQMGETLAFLLREDDLNKK